MQRKWVTSTLWIAEEINIITMIILFILRFLFVCFCAVTATSWFLHIEWNLFIPEHSAISSLCIIVSNRVVKTWYCAQDQKLTMLRWPRLKECQCLTCNSVIANGQWNPWGPWSGCSKSCDGGWQRRVRVCQGAAVTGQQCDGSGEEVRKCSDQRCPGEPKDNKARIRMKAGR